MLLSLDMYQTVAVAVLVLLLGTVFLVELLPAGHLHCLRTS